MNRTQRRKIKDLRELEAGRRSFKKINVQCIKFDSLEKNTPDDVKRFSSDIKELNGEAEKYRTKLREFKKSCRNNAKVVMET